MTVERPHWTPARPNTLVIACSDGRLQEATDEFLARQFQVTRYDRFYVPGGAGALSSSGADPIRADRMSGECRYLIELHAVRRVILMFHGPSLSGRIETACADYRRKLPWASIIQLREQQERDADELLDRRGEWACDAGILVYRAEVDAAGGVTFVNLDPDSKHGSERVIQREGS